MPTWVEALQEWNSGKGSWCIPRKDTPEHAQVKALMEGKVKKKKKKVIPKSKSKSKPEPKPEIKKSVDVCHEYDTPKSIEECRMRTTNSLKGMRSNSDTIKMLLEKIKARNK